MPALDLPLPLLHAGKVRDVYDAGDGRLLLVASDRLSAFDVVMAEPVPDKGRVLTAMSAWWFEKLAPVTANHVLSLEPASLPAGAQDARLAGRMMLVQRCDMLPVECIVRGYLAGSAWKEYAAAGTVHGQRLPAGLREAERLPEPVFTPSTKAESGTHDENISFDAAVALLGPEVAEQARAVSLAVFRAASARCEAAGFLLADTKLELGWSGGRLLVADEVLTPDSSRFWEAATWAPGTSPPGFDKQPVRDELEATGWDKRPPPPPLSAATIDATRARYVAAYERITGRRFADWPGTPLT